MLQRPCLDCPGLALPGRSRCAVCDRATQQRKKVRRASAPGNGAQRRLRAAIKRAEWVRCAGCQHLCHSSMVEADHITPLADGGADVDINVQPLCTACHRRKTGKENAARNRIA